MTDARPDIPNAFTTQDVLGVVDRVPRTTREIFNVIEPKSARTIVTSTGEERYVSLPRSAQKRKQHLQHVLSNLARHGKVRTGIETVDDRTTYYWWKE